MYTGFRELPAAPRRRSVDTDRDVRLRVPTFVWGLGIVSLLTDASTEMVGTALPLYLSTWLRVGPVALASVDAIQQIMTAVMRLGTSLVADRTRRHRAVASVGYTVSAMSKVLLAFGVPTTTIVAGSVAVDRFGKGIRTGPRDALITAGTPARRLGAAFGVHRALDAVGAFIGPLLTYLILRSTNGTGFHAVFAVAALVGVLGVLALVLLVPATPEPDQPVYNTTRTIHPPLRLLMLAGLIGCCTIGDALVLIVLLRSASLSNSTYPLLAVAASLVFAVLAGPFGRLADRVRPIRVYLAGTAVLATTYLAVGRQLPTSQGIVLLVLAAIGVSYAATDGVLAALVARVSEGRTAATAQASVQTATALGRASGSAMFGVLWARSGPAAAFRAFGVALLIATIVGALADHSRTLDSPDATFGKNP